MKTERKTEQIQRQHNKGNTMNRNKDHRYPQIVSCIYNHEKIAMKDLCSLTELSEKTIRKVLNMYVYLQYCAQLLCRSRSIFRICCYKGSFTCSC